MSHFKEGSWQIEAVRVNKSTVMNHEGFQNLEFEDGKLSIHPAGMQFEVEPETMFSAVLKARGQNYFADWTVDGDELELVLSRPELKDTITIHAKLEPAQVPTMV